MEIQCIKNLLAFNRVPLLFVGSGLTKRYVSEYPSWEQLLNKIATTIGLSNSQYVNLFNKIKTQYENDFDIYIEVASALEQKFIERIDLEGEEYLSTLFDKDELFEINSNKLSHFKCLVAKQFSTLAITGDLDEIKALKSAVQKCPVLMTTNYDKFLEDHILPKDFTSFVRQEEYFCDKSFNIKELYKLHGTIDDPTSIILTKKDYYDFDKKLLLVSSKLMTLLSEYPIVFIGYSLSDTNIQKIISNLMSCLNKEQLSKIQNSFIFIKWEPNQPEIVEQINSYQLEDGKTINMTTISTDNYLEIYNNLNMFSPKLPIDLIKKTRELIRDLITTTTDKEKIYCNELEKADENEFAIYLGNKSTITSMEGYKGIQTDDMILDSLYDKNKYNASQILTITLVDKVRQKILLPVFYYRKKEEDIILPEKVKIYIDEKRSSYFSNKVIKNYLTKEVFTKDYSYLIDLVASEEKNYKILKTILRALYDKKEIFTTENLKELLIKLYEKDNTILSDSQFRRLVMYSDMI